MWKLWARKNKNGFHDIGSSKRCVEMHSNHDPIVKIIATESDNGNYHGWLMKDEATPYMIWHSEAQLKKCFYYGYEIEEKNGRGQYIKLNIETT